MLKYLLTSAFRHLLRTKVFSLINIAGLSMGLTAFILIMLYVRFELSYDRFHEHANHLYRVATNISLQNETIGRESTTYEGVIEFLKDDHTQVEDVTAISGFDSESTLIRLHVSEDIVPVSNYKGLYADDSFFNVFSFPLRSGERGSVLTPYSAVISEEWASTYFNGNAIGKTIQFTDDSSEPKLLTVKGVMQPPPLNSHLKFDIVINIPEEETNFWLFGGYTYVRLKETADPANIESRLDALARQKMV